MSIAQETRTPVARALVRRTYRVVMLSALIGGFFALATPLAAQPIPVVQDNELVEAARRGDIEVMKNALVSGMRGDRNGVNGLNALHVAAQFGHLAAVETLLQFKPKINHRSKERQTALGYAVLNGHGAIVQLLVRAGADPDRSGANYEPPLVVAARRGDKLSVEALLAADADRDLGDNTGRTALQWARQLRHREIIKLLEAR